MDAIELFRGSAVTAQNEADWEEKLGLKPNIATWKDQLNTQMSKFVSGSADLTLVQCGTQNACEAWRILADAGC